MSKREKETMTDGLHAFLSGEGRWWVEGDDCLDVLPRLPEACADAIVTDPPYFLPATHYNVRTGGFRSLADLGMLEHFFRDVFSAIRRVLKPQGSMYVFCDGQSYPVFYALAYCHFKRLRPLVWDKGTAINGFAWRHQHELILFAEREDAPAVKTGDGDVLRCRAVAIDDREHLAQKPVELFRRLIAKTTPPGGLVLDPFVGSASSGLAALGLGMRFLGIEKDATYCRLARERLAQPAGPLFTGSSQQSLFPVASVRGEGTHEQA